MMRGWQLISLKENDCSDSEDDEHEHEHEHEYKANNESVKHDGHLGGEFVTVEV